MDRYGSGGSIQISSKLQDLTPFGANPTDWMRYLTLHSMNSLVAVWWRKVDVGGLEDEDDDLGSSGFEEEEFQLDKEEVSV
ncbi:hypothetical protein OROMI_023473 [Orobanche minor]